LLLDAALLRRSAFRARDDDERRPLLRPRRGEVMRSISPRSYCPFSRRASRITCALTASGVKDPARPSTTSYRFCVRPSVCTVVVSMRSTVRTPSLRVTAT
jgi:hypothetical protein